MTPEACNPDDGRGDLRLARRAKPTKPPAAQEPEAPEPRLKRGELYALLGLVGTGLALITGFFAVPAVDRLINPVVPAAAPPAGPQIYVVPESAIKTVPAPPVEDPPGEQERQKGEGTSKAPGTKKGGASAQGDEPPLPKAKMLRDSETDVVPTDALDRQIAQGPASAPPPPTSNRSAPPTEGAKPKNLAPRGAVSQLAGMDGVTISGDTTITATAENLTSRAENGSMAKNSIGTIGGTGPRTPEDARRLAAFNLSRYGVFLPKYLASDFQQAIWGYASHGSAGRPGRDFVLSEDNPELGTFVRSDGSVAQAASLRPDEVIATENGWLCRVGRAAPSDPSGRAYLRCARTEVLRGYVLETVDKPRPARPPSTPPK